MSQRTLTPDELLTARLAVSIEELAGLTGMSRSTISRQIAAGEIRASRARRRVLIPVDEVRRIVGLSEVA